MMQSKMYRINAGWIFDKENMIGYRVNMEKRQVKGFTYAFKLDKTDENKFTSEIYGDVPIGVVRKATEIVELAR